MKRENFPIEKILVKEIDLLRRKVLQALEDSGPVVDQSIDAAGVVTESSRNFAARDVFKFGIIISKLFPICQRGLILPLMKILR